MNLSSSYISLIFTGFTLSFLISLVMMPILIAVSHKWEWLDDPNHRKMHTEPISRLGGIGIFSALVISGILAPILVTLVTGGNFLLGDMLRPNIYYISATVLIFIIGLLDDFAEMRSSLKLIGQIVVAVLVCVGGAAITKITIPFIDFQINLAWASWPITILWIIGVTNSINLIDGIDGLSATISLIAFIVYASVFLITGHLVLSLVSFIIAGSLFGYLYFNFPPAKLFMGDSGSQLLGFILAILPLLAEPGSGSNLIMPLTLLSIPILDVFFSIARRTRKRIAFSNPDKEHVHHKLMAIGFENRTILAIVSSLMMIFGIPVILFYILPENTMMPFIIATWLLIVFLFLVLHKVYHKTITEKK